MLQLIAHSWIAALLFSMLGECYEAHGSRCAKQLVLLGTVGTGVLLILLANSVLSAMHYTQSAMALIMLT